MKLGSHLTAGYDFATAYAAFKVRRRIRKRTQVLGVRSASPSRPGDRLQNVSKTAGESRRIARTPVAVHATLTPYGSSAVTRSRAPSPT